LEGTPLPKKNRYPKTVGQPQSEEFIKKMWVQRRIYVFLFLYSSRVNKICFIERITVWILTVHYVV